MKEAHGGGRRLHAVRRRAAGLPGPFRQALNRMLSRSRPAASRAASPDPTVQITGA